MKLESFVSGQWHTGSGEGTPLVNPVTGEKIAEATSSGVDMSAAMEYARSEGSSALGSLSFEQRGALLKDISSILIANRQNYDEIARENCGNTKLDAAIDIDGAISVLRYYARIGASLKDQKLLCESGEDQLSKEPVFFGRHYWTSRPGIAVQINAFNFPAWGMWEKIAVATLAGVPSLAKPATSTAVLANRMMRDVVEAGVIPAGVLNLVCGRGEGLLDAVGSMDSIAFTGSADTGQMIRAHKNILQSGVRVNIEADSLNATLVGPDVAPGTMLFDLAVRETVKALSIKAGQLCTNIRRVFVPRAILGEFADAVAAGIDKLVVGDPVDEQVRVGPLVNKQQQQQALIGIAELSAEAKMLRGGSERLDSNLHETGAFVAPTLLLCEDPAGSRVVHELEVFGPCVTAMPYDNFDGGLALAARGGGSLAVSLFSDAAAVHGQGINYLGPWHGRLMIVDEDAGKNHSGHSIVMPQCTHGGPGRAGGGEELGGLRGLRLHMQRTALQGSSKVHGVLSANAAEVTL